MNLVTTDKCVFLNRQATSVTIKREKNLGYALPLNTKYQSL